MLSAQKSIENITSKMKKSRRSVMASKNLKSKTLNTDVDFIDDNFTLSLLNNNSMSYEEFESLPINYSRLLNVDFKVNFYIILK